MIGLYRFLFGGGADREIMAPKPFTPISSGMPHMTVMGDDGRVSLTYRDCLRAPDIPGFVDMTVSQLNNPDFRPVGRIIVNNEHITFWDLPY